MTVTANLARLGLTDSATDADIEEAYAELAAYLELAPRALEEWAADELAEVDRAYADLLARKADPIPDTETADRSKQVLLAPTNGHAKLRLRSRMADFDALTDTGDLLDGHVGPAPARRAQPDRLATPQRRTGKHAPVEQRQAQPALIRLSPKARRLGLVAAGFAALAVLVVGVFMFGNAAVPPINGTPAPSAQAGPDPAVVAELMQKIAANPQDAAALQDLADIYYTARDWDTASIWLDKLLAVDPTNTAALLGRGAAAYNIGDYETAEQKWRAVLAVDDSDVEAHYDLGWLYFSVEPPKPELARAEWNRVVELVPADSDIARTVETHLAQLDALGTGSPSPGSSAGPTATPETSSPSVAPTGSAP